MHLTHSMLKLLLARAFCIGKRILQELSIICSLLDDNHHKLSPWPAVGLDCLRREKRQPTGNAAKSGVRELRRASKEQPDPLLRIWLFRQAGRNRPFIILINRPPSAI